MSSINFSVICCYYNELNILKKKFDRFEKFSSELNFDHEFIFVDNNSTDGSKEFLKKEEQKRNKNFVFIFNEKNLGKGGSIKNALSLTDKKYAIIFDIDEYVVDISNKEGLADGLQEIDGGVTVHNACHARAQNMGIKARDMLKNIPNIKLDVVERCAGHGGTFGVMKQTHDLANKVGRPTARQIDNKKNKYMASDCPLAGKHLNQLSKDTEIRHDEALHPIEIMAKSYKL